VFEYLTTDLKKYMDRSGKGPNFPLQKTVIKVRMQNLGLSGICLGLLSCSGGQQLRSRQLYIVCWGADALYVAP
jgi:hypothetical protein